MWLHNSAQFFNLGRHFFIVIIIIYNYRPGSEHMYGFSVFTCSLNESEPGVCPTDSRLRPDQRIMENGDYDNANIEKVCSIQYPFEVTFIQWLVIFSDEILLILLVV